jgi:hypothetical protein
MPTTLQNFYKQTILVACTSGATTIYVSTKPTISSGYLVISPNNSALREIVQYTATGTDGTGDFITVSARGVGGTTAQAHSATEPIRMNITAQHWADLNADVATKYGAGSIIPAPTISTDVANKGYVDGIAVAGAPDADASTKGITKLSVAAASPTNPISVGDNDPRVPTQNENDALVGTSGTAVSSSNKLVDNTDTTGTGLIQRASALTNFVSSVESFTATETITAGQSVVSRYIQADGGGQVDTTATKRTAGSGTTFSDTFNITVASNNDRALVVFVSANRASGGATSGLTTTINGTPVTATQVTGNTGTNANNYAIWSYVVFNPPTGVNSILVEGTSNGQTWNVNSTAYSLYNIDDTAIDAFSGVGIWTEVSSNSITQVTNGAVILSANIDIAALVAFSDNAQSSAVTQNNAPYLTTGFSGTSPNSGSKTVTTATPVICISNIALRPATVITFGGVALSSASTPTNSVNLDKYNTFLGFATESKTSGQAILVRTSGTMTGLSGITQGVPYYLSNTAGTIATTAGTNSKKIGFGLSTTEVRLNGN